MSVERGKVQIDEREVVRATAIRAAMMMVELTAKHFVEMHGGTLVLDITPGRGATATVRLPAARTVASAAADLAPVESRSAAG